MLFVECLQCDDISADFDVKFNNKESVAVTLAKDFRYSMGSVLL